MDAISRTVCRVTLQPEDQSVEVHAGTTLREALALLGVTVMSPCGGEGTCGKCRVQVTEGEEALTPLTTSDRSLLGPDRIGSGYRLSCQARVSGDVVVTVPPASQTSEMRVLHGGISRKVPAEPAVAKTAVEVTDQTLSEAHARLEQLRLCGDLRLDLRADVDLLRRMPDILDRSGGQVTAVVRGIRLLDLEPGDTSSRCFGLALDLGTTTVVASLTDLTSSQDMGFASTVNGQTAYGHDVIGRINMTIEEPDGLETLRQTAVGSLNDVIEQVLDRADVKREEVYEAVVVGNATMMHLFLGIPPASLGKLPYVATVGDPVEAGAGELGLGLAGCAQAYVLPNIAGFVGADTVGVVLAAEFDEDDGRTRMVVDIGTNCEIALRIGERLIVSSTPAGPAFEGARISSGMYAAPGAIEEVRIDDGEVHCKVIGKGEPRGICGSGLVDIGAELLRTGIVDWTGRLLPVEELDGGVPQGLRDRVRNHDSELAFVLAESENGDSIVLTQRDFRELQLAKGAIRSGIEILLERAGLTVDDLDEFCVAGGFGSYLDKDNAIRLGLIPKLPTEKLRFIGNGALMGAKLALLSGTMRHRGAHVARVAEHIQIAGTPDFQMRFSEAMLFES